MSTFSDSLLSTFRSSFGGTVLKDGDDEYDATLARAVWNGDIRRRPAVIAEPLGAADVATAVSFARRHDLDLTVRGGGHSFAGHAVSDGGLMIDLGALNDVAVDAANRRARCGGGARWSELDAATAGHGLAVTGGFVSHTGVGGLTLGGGMGWLTRRAGLSCDNLVSAEVVTADGRTVTASTGTNPDLFWALRGGGGNFGVVTSFEFALHELPPMANAGLFFWRPEDAKMPLQLARDLIHALPREYGGFIGGLSAPPAPFVPESLHGATVFLVAVVSWDTPEALAAAVAPLRVLGPLFELVTPIPYAALQQLFDASVPWGILGYEKALYLDQLSDAVIDIAIEHLPRKQSPLTFLPIFALGGAFADVPEGETAFGGNRATKWTFNIAALATEHDVFAADRAWARGLWDALRPHGMGAAGYINFLSDEDEDRVRATYGEAKYRRLSEVKAAWDPDNVFHHNANIRPAVAATVS